MVSTLPQGWLPQVVILDSMFLINTKPLRQTKTLANYAQLIFDRFALQHFKAGASEVHFVFDNPGQQPFNPKQFEHGRRDCTQKMTSHHQHISFTPETALPQAWPEYIGCRLCKRSIVEGIGLTFFKQGSYMVRPGQKLVLAGCFSGSSCQGKCSAWVVQANEISLIPEPAPQYQSNAEEADARIWRHAKQSMANDILIYSPDTDIYNTGLGLLHTCTMKRFIVQLNIPKSAEQKYLHLNSLSLALQNDPDLASIPQQHIAPTLQSLFICTGCDFVSYFKSIGKVTFFNNFFQHTKFICDNGMSGSLHQTSIHNKSSELLSFLRLVGTVYFKKHLAAFNSQYGHEAPQHLFNSIDSTVTNQERHQLWLQKIIEKL